MSAGYSIIPFAFDELNPAGTEIEVLCPVSGQITYCTLGFHLATLHPTTVTVRVQNEAGATPAAFIEISYTFHLFYSPWRNGAAEGSVPVVAGERIFIRVVANADGATYFYGHLIITES